MRFRLQWLYLSLCAPLSLARGQTRPEIIRGQIKTDSGVVLVAADIIVTMAPNREVFRATSDSSGRYQIAIEKGTGDYLVYVGATGRRAFRKRVMRSGNDSVFVLDAALAKEVTTVAAVRTTAQRTRPPRGDDAPAQVGALSTQFAGVVGALSPDQIGDLAAMASTVPGVTTTPDGGISIFGLDPSQNRMQVNGMAFDGGSLPRDLPIRARVSSSVFDPTVGGFGGALIAVDIAPGQSLSLGRAHLTLDAPQLQAADATARSLGQRYSRIDGSYSRSGEIVQDLWVYSAAIQGSRRASPAPSLLSANASMLERLGVSADSAHRLTSILGAMGAPLQAGGVGSDQASTSVSGAFRLDRAQSSSFGPSVDTRFRVSLTGGGAVNRSAPAFASALAPSSHDAHSSSGNGWLQAGLSQYFGDGASYLSETKTGVSFTTQQTTPYLAVPSGTVRVTSNLSDGTQSVGGLQFGGASVDAHTTTWRWESSNELSFSPLKAPAHRIKVFTQAQVDAYRETGQSNTLGTFTYNSLADLQANVPASYSKSLYSPARDGGEMSGAFAVADYWTKSPELQFVFGPRVEWNTFTRIPLDNPEVARVFGTSTGTSPGGIHVSPRFGFSWLYPGARVAGRGGVSASQLGAQYSPPRGVLRGGIGEFRAQYSPSLLSSAIAGTGLAGATALRLSCVGSAVPTPSWADYASNAASAPSACANGTGAAQFADASPSVQLFDPSYTAARRWTANLNWSSALDWALYSFDAAYSLNLDQPGIVDLNYSGAPNFTLDNENNRPVFVRPASIVSSSGLVSPLDARVSTEFGRVVSRRSDLRSDVKQATVSLFQPPNRRIAQFMLSGSYTYASSRALTRGFDGATFGDPAIREWSIGGMPAHQLRIQAGYSFRKLNSSFTTYWGFQSGYAYTPLVAGDVNGDGLSNDRAFVFKPSNATPEVAKGMTDLLASTTAQARDCLERQLGGVAERNSCRRPWSATMNARFNWNHRFGDLWHYVSGSVNFANPLAGIDQLLHGGDKLRGWGLPAAPDPTLLYVRGFDQSTKRFIYEMNPRFGNTRPSLSALYNPFRVTVDITFSLSGNVQRQQLEQFLRPTRGAPGVRPPADTILRRLRSTGISAASPYFWILANSDSLLLSPTQLNALNSGAAHRQAAIDSTYRALSIELASLPMDYKADVVMAHYQEVNRSIFNFPASESDYIKSVLSPIQLRLIPAALARDFNLVPSKP